MTIGIHFFYVDCLNLVPYYLSVFDNGVFIALLDKDMSVSIRKWVEDDCWFDNDEMNFQKVYFQRLNMPSLRSERMNLTKVEMKSL